MEFLQLPEHALPIDEPRVESCLVCNGGIEPQGSNHRQNSSKGEKSPKHMKLYESVHRWKIRYGYTSQPFPLRNDKYRDQPVISVKGEACSVALSRAAKSAQPPDIAETCFATQ